MSSGPPAVPRFHRLFRFFDPEAAAVASILLGLFQVMLSVPLYYMPISRPKALFLVPLGMGSLIAAAGSMGVASEKSPSRQLLKGCAYTNVIGLMGALVALCVYGIAFNSIQSFEPCVQTTDSPHSRDHLFYTPSNECPTDYLESFFWSVTLMLVLYDLGALFLQSLLSVSAFKGLKAN